MRALLVLLHTFVYAIEGLLQRLIWWYDGYGVLCPACKQAWSTPPDYIRTDGNGPYCRKCLSAWSVAGIALRRSYEKKLIDRILTGQYDVPFALGCFAMIVFLLVLFVQAQVP